MRHPSSDIRTTRRQQIVDAAVAVITAEGIQHLSLSAIEKRAGMSRGQLTYYFRSKEAILLAVFDHLLALMYERIGTPGGPDADSCSASTGAWVRHLLETLLTRPPVSPAFSCLQHTFLAQIGHRADFRRRLATLYAEWRGHMADGLAEDLARIPGAPAVSPRALASFIQALLHGLAVQRAADPDAFDPAEMLQLCLDVLGGYVRLSAVRSAADADPVQPRNGSSPRRRARRVPRSRERQP